MKVRIEVEIGGKLIMDEHEIPNEQFRHVRYPIIMINSIESKIWDRMINMIGEALDGPKDQS